MGYTGPPSAAHKFTDLSQSQVRDHLVIDAGRFTATGIGQHQANDRRSASSSMASSANDGDHYRYQWQSSVIITVVKGSIRLMIGDHYRYQRQSSVIITVVKGNHRYHHADHGRLLPSSMAVIMPILGTTSIQPL